MMEREIFEKCFSTQDKDALFSLCMAFHAAMNEKNNKHAQPVFGELTFPGGIEGEIRPYIDRITQIVLAHFPQITFENLCDKSRKRDFVVPRHLCMYLTHEYAEMSLKAIGQHFGGRDHSSVIHAITAIEDLRDTNHKFANLLTLISKDVSKLFTVEKIVDNV